MSKNGKKDFYPKVYDFVKTIPFGRVTTYGIIAKKIGHPQSARMVGWALNASHNSKEFVPAHRVVNRNGMLTGKHHFGGIKTMEELLISENIRVKDDKIIDFEKKIWSPGN